jgi:hypothetical protein
MHETPHFFASSCPLNVVEHWYPLGLTDVSKIKWHDFEIFICENPGYCNGTGFSEIATDD